MNNIIIQKPKLNMQTIGNELELVNSITDEYGLSLSSEQLIRIHEERIQALKDMNRVEFGEGIIIMLIRAFKDSPYIHQDNYEEIICELQEIFYYFKNEAMERLSDDYLIAFMKDAFDNKCHGSIEHLGSTTLEEFCRELREDE